MDPWAIEVTSSSYSSSTCTIPIVNLDGLAAAEVNKLSESETEAIHSAGTGGVAVGLDNTTTTTSEFDDNFTPNQNQKSIGETKSLSTVAAADKSSSSFQKLPDSETYLASLESKLSKIKSKPTKPSEESKDLVKSLEQTRESYMIQLLAGSDPTTQIEIPIEDNLQINPILKKIAPEKQATSAQELVKLINADQLQQQESVESGTEEITIQEINQ